MLEEASFLHSFKLNYTLLNTVHVKLAKKGNDVKCLHPGKMNKHETCVLFAQVSYSHVTRNGVLTKQIKT